MAKSVGKKVRPVTPREVNRIVAKYVGQLCLFEAVERGRGQICGGISSDYCLTKLIMAVVEDAPATAGGVDAPPESPAGIAIGVPPSAMICF